MNVLQALLGEFYIMKQSFSAGMTKLNLVTRISACSNGCAPPQHEMKKVVGVMQLNRYLIDFIQK